MIKIREMELNNTGTTALVVASVSARKTRRGSDYLTLELFDGSDKITGNYWNWRGNNIPALKTILDIEYTVTEYNGNKQLNISAMHSNNKLTLDEFMPNLENGGSIEKVFDEALRLVEQLNDMYLLAICEAALKNYRHLWLHVPGAKSVHHAFMGGTLVHCLSTAKIARSIAENIDIANIDLVTAGALLHDIGKLKAYEITGVVIDMTDTGLLFDHLYLGAKMLQDIANSVCPIDELNEAQIFRLEQLQHIILSHHGEKEYGAVINPATVEAHIVYQADTIDAEMQMLREAAKKSSGKWTDKIWTLHNVPHIRPQFTERMMSFETTRSETSEG